MSSLPAPRHPSPSGSARTAGYAVSIGMFGLVGWFVAGISDAALVPSTAVLALASALALGIIGVRNQILASPLILLGVPLLLSLAAAMSPITRIFGDWTLESLTVAILIVVAPLTGVGAAMLVVPARTALVEHTTGTVPHPRRLIAVCLLMSVAGAAVYAYEWAGVGGPPLLSSDIDEARFALEYGLLHVVTQGLPLALLIFTWARVASAKSFTAVQRRGLEAGMCFVLIVLALGGGRTLALVPLITALVVASRYLSPLAARRVMFAVALATLLFSSAIFLAREEQRSSAVSETVLYNDTGTKSSPLQSSFRALIINFGEPLRVIAELHEADVQTPPFTTSIWFAHNLVGRAVDPQTITAPNAGGWLTAAYAGPLLLDFGLVGALMFGFLLGAGAHLLYRGFVRGRSVTSIWVYAYLAGPLALSFYINIFLYFVYPIIDLIALFALSRLLTKPATHPSAS